MCPLCFFALQLSSGRLFDLGLGELGGGGGAFESGIGLGYMCGTVGA